MNTTRIYAPGDTGRGSAGQCPAMTTAKTPAARQQVFRVAGRGQKPRGTSACASVCGEEVAP